MPSTSGAPATDQRDAIKNWTRKQQVSNDSPMSEKQTVLVQLSAVTSGHTTASKSWAAIMDLVV